MLFGNTVLVLRVPYSVHMDVRSIQTSQDPHTRTTSTSSRNDLGFLPGTTGTVLDSYICYK